MADRYTFDLDTEHPNVDIDGLRRATKQAIADLQGTVSDVDDAFFLTNLLAALLDSALASADTAAAERQQLRADLGTLTARVTALEPPPTDPPLEVP